MRAGARDEKRKKEGRKRRMVCQCVEKGLCTRTMLQSGERRGCRDQTNQRNREEGGMGGRVNVLRDWEGGKRSKKRK